MASERIYHDDNESRFFTAPQAYGLVRERRPGRLAIATENTPRGRAVLCFLSPFDALIEVGHFTRLGQVCHTVSASEIGHKRFLRASRHELIACLHLGWLARDGRILARPGIEPRRYIRTLHQEIRIPLSLEVGEESIRALDRLHEAAGLFAWRETIGAFRNWGERNVAEVVDYALRSMMLTLEFPSSCNQLALFDPEFAQWHFVPIADAADIGDIK
ncbi:hypothetical protein SAMN05444172_9087 [Burkholderia sp. GAS332]|nr:hypothetical protein SAMN05444172_9087 [Burkholderia sp. GAS332]